MQPNRGELREIRQTAADPPCRSAWRRGFGRDCPGHLSLAANKEDWAEAAFASEICVHCSRTGSATMTICFEEAW